MIKAFMKSQRHYTDEWWRREIRKITYFLHTVLLSVLPVS